MEEIAPGILLDSTFQPHNLVLIKSEDSIVVVDSPSNPVDAMNWQEKVFSLVDHVDFMIVTDASPERQFALMLWNVPIIASETLYKAMTLYDEERARRDLVQHFLELYPEAGQFVDHLNPRKPTIAFNHRLFLHNRTPPIQLETVNGAAPGSLWVVLSDLGLLITGDTVCSDDVPPFGNNTDSKAWLTTLATLSRRHSIKRIVTGRGKAPVQRGEIEQQREFLRVMRRAARKLARGSYASGNITEVAHDLGQTFFNRRGQRAVKQIKLGLEKLILEIEKEQTQLEVASENEQSSV
jgi:glyoxylase-like metal-dependent hydrolase (beta-lactamase superfamily II)